MRKVLASGAAAVLGVALSAVPASAGPTSGSTVLRGPAVGGGEVTVRVGREDGAILLTADDSGPGIPEEERERVFERFYRIIGTQAEGSGLMWGVGLAIVAGGAILVGTGNGKNTVATSTTGTP